MQSGREREKVRARSGGAGRVAPEGAAMNMAERIVGFGIGEC